MKANELSAKDLMIGDWVYNTHNSNQEQVCEVWERMVMLDYNDLYNYDEIEPIPLTPEILEKNGFIKQGPDGWEYIHPDDTTFSYVDYKILWRTDYDNHLFIKKYKGSGTSATLQISYINFVHQLQHALKLCGIEKEIEL